MWQHSELSLGFSSQTKPVQQNKHKPRNISNVTISTVLLYAIIWCSVFLKKHFSWIWTYVGWGKVGKENKDTHANRKWPFCILGQCFEHNFGQIVCIRAEELNNTNLVAPRHIKGGMGSFPVACTIDGNELLVKSVCETAPKSLLWIPTCVPGFEYAPWLAC